MWLMPPYWSGTTLENKISLRQEGQGISEKLTLFFYQSSDISVFARF